MAPKSRLETKKTGINEYNAEKSTTLGLDSLEIDIKSCQIMGCTFRAINGACYPACRYLRFPPGFCERYNTIGIAPWTLSPVRLRPGTTTT